jgi:hypothetical protein
MFAGIRQRLTYGNVVSTLCLFILLGGGAYAATSSVGGVIHGCVTRTGVLKIASSSTRCPRPGRAITFNQTGPRGLTGATGVQGMIGPQGMPGPIGPSHAYSATTLSVALAATDTTVETLNLPAGSYDIRADLLMHGEKAGTYQAGGFCTLTAGSDSDTSEIDGGATGGQDVAIPMSLTVLHTFAAPGSAVLTCNGVTSPAGGFVYAQYDVVSAIEVGAIN